MIGYRGIKPVLSFDSNIHPLNRSQFVWYGEEGNLALFAGQEVAVWDRDGAFSLTYLDMKHPSSFSSLEEAKQEAPDFVRAVLFRMLEIVGVRHDDQSLMACLQAGGK